MPTHRFRAFDGVSLSTRVSGEGPAVLQLPGGPGMANYLPDPPAGLAAQVVSPDLRGTGASAGGPHGIERALDDAEALRRSLGLGAWDLVIGHSSGADLALAYAAERRDAVEQLVSVCGTGVQDDRGWHAAYDAARDDEPDLGIPQDEAVRRALRDDWRRWIHRPDLFPTLAEVRPTPLFVVAELDIRPSWPLAQLATMYDAELRVLDGVGHDVWHTHPGTWWDLVREVVDRPHPEPDHAEELERVRQQLAILEALTDAADDARAVLELVLTSADVATARRRLMSERGLTEPAASAVLDVQVRRFATVERERIRQARDELRRSAADALGT